MKKVKNRAWASLLIALLLVVGLAVYLVRRGLGQLFLGRHTRRHHTGPQRRDAVHLHG